MTPKFIDLSHRGQPPSSAPLIASTKQELVKQAEQYVEAFCSKTGEHCGEVATRFHAAVLLDEVKRLRHLNLKLKIILPGKTRKV